MLCYQNKKWELGNMAEKTDKKVTLKMVAEKAGSPQRKIFFRNTRFF